VSEVLLQASGISKRFPGVQALKNVSLTLHRAEVLAVVGENGAGKSTLMKILAGVQAPDQGEIRWEDKPIILPSVHAAEERGIVLIHQELSLAGNLDIAANIFLGREKTWGGPLKLLSRGMYAEAETIMRRLGLEGSARRLVSTLPVGQQQLVEIARALSLKSRILIMDEPTSSLTQRETERLFVVIRDLQRDGVSILYISHRLPEVKTIADRVVVLRDGQNAGELPKAEITTDAMIRLMVGRDLRQFHHHSHRPKTGQDQVLLDVQQVRWSEQQREGVTLQVRVGEIVGLAGLMGAGRTELAETLFGLRPKLSGEVRLQGKPLHITAPRQATAAGLFLIPEDRRWEGLLLTQSVRFNISLASLERLQFLRLVHPQQERQLATTMCSKLNVRTPNVRQTVDLLSGGNQQKVVLAKGLARAPKVLILDEPTRGVDVGAKAEIYALMDELAREGVGILMISSDMEEVLGISDRVVVMHQGRITGSLNRAEMSEEAVMRLATGGNVGQVSNLPTNRQV
jgi:ribose transport system ATP-binding protein